MKTWPTKNVLSVSLFSCICFLRRLKQMSFATEDQVMCLKAPLSSQLKQTINWNGLELLFPWSRRHFDTSNMPLSFFSLFFPPVSCYLLSKNSPINSYSVVGCKCSGADIDYFYWQVTLFTGSFRNLKKECIFLSVWLILLLNLIFTPLHSSCDRNRKHQGLMYKSYIRMKTRRMSVSTFQCSKSGLNV